MELQATTDASPAPSARSWVDALVEYAFPVFALCLLGLWPLVASFDIASSTSRVVGEAMGVVVAIGAYGFIRKLEIRALSLGWGIVTLGLMADMMDEFQPSPPLFDAIEGVCKVVGYALLGVGFYLSYNRIQAQLVRSRELERRIRSSEEQFRRLFEEAPVGYHEAAPDGTIIRANRVAHRLLGVEQGALVGRNIRDLPLYVDELEAPSGPEGVGGTAVKTLSYVDRSGDVAVLELHVERVEGSEATTDTVRTALLDVTARKRLEEERIELQDSLATSRKLEAVGQLSTGIAHEINTPIQYIADNLRFLRESLGHTTRLASLLVGLREAAGKGPLPESLLGEVDDAVREADLDYLLSEAPEAVEQSLSGVERVSTIVQAMKHYAHPAEARVETDINSAIVSTITVARNEWASVAEVDTDLDPELPRVMCHPGEINQVVLNMLVNAAHAIADGVDALPEKGTITVRTGRSGDDVEIVVEDTGAGMTPEVRERIFDPFFTTKEVGRGTGQGLSLAHAIVARKHEGSIEVESTPGVGSRFTIRLPIGGSAGGAAA